MKTNATSPLQTDQGLVLFSERILPVEVIKEVWVKHSTFGKATRPYAEIVTAYGTFATEPFSDGMQAKIALAELWLEMIKARR